MNLTTRTAGRIARRYNQTRDWTGKTDFSRVLEDLLLRDGLAILTEDARRELILTLGENKRASHAAALRREAKFAAMRAAASIAAE